MRLLLEILSKAELVPDHLCDKAEASFRVTENPENQ